MGHKRSMFAGFIGVMAILMGWGPILSPLLAYRLGIGQKIFKPETSEALLSMTIDLVPVFILVGLVVTLGVAFAVGRLMDRDQDK